MTTSVAHERHVASGTRSLYCQWCGTWPLIEDAARSCCGHRWTCPNGKPKDKARWLKAAEERRARGRLIREVTAAAHEVVLFWYRSSTAKASAMDSDINRLHQALNALEYGK